MAMKLKIFNNFHSNKFLKCEKNPFEADELGLKLFDLSSFSNVCFSSLVKF